uniref:Secreted protein n=1 Tax=Haemonchus placei TaxID=6290 RepID=A0A158QRB8_HAEPC
LARAASTAADPMAFSASIVTCSAFFIASSISASFPSCSAAAAFDFSTRSLNALRVSNVLSASFSVFSATLSASSARALAASTSARRASETCC